MWERLQSIQYVGSVGFNTKDNKMKKCHCFKNVDIYKVQKYYVHTSIFTVEAFLLKCARHYGYQGYNKEGYMVFNTTWNSLSGLSEYCGDMTGFCFDFYMD